MDQVKELIKELQTSKSYRPTVVNFLYQIGENGPEVLLVRSKNKGKWGPVKGGIEMGESLESALNRETLEEINLPRTGMTDRVYNIIGPTFVNYQEGSRRRDGFTEGKVYFWCGSKYVPDREIMLNPQEVTGAVWIKPETVRVWLPESNPEKTNRYVKALEKLMSSIRQPISP